MPDLRVFNVARTDSERRVVALLRMTAGLLAATRDAYERWAPLYPPEPHNPLMRAEQRMMLEHCPQVGGRHVLDLACGRGRYARLLEQRHAAVVVALDFCMPMLTQVRGAQRVCASMMQLPFAADTFDVVVSGLAVGHAPDLKAWLHEAARVLRPGGTLLYSDFHPDAAPHFRRSFSDHEHRTWTVPHYCHTLKAQASALRACGLKVEATREVRVGVELDEPFVNSDSFYARWRGLAMVLVIRAGK